MSHTPSKDTHPPPLPFQHVTIETLKVKDDGGTTYLNVSEEHLQHVGAGVPGVEEHELGLLQVVGGKPFLNVQMSGLRKSSRCPRA
ncbi:hypothetical protein Baya_7120 [Bagarius yarrelli]|uniref:Uncharacterized protein n=1 Tax=Bagarius yarrelli TaxID=175774 RepID=A0A556TZD0_BAGYA|nr:hypothetical protein Baya_7120 [Bagarius yarrelli]